MHTAAEGNGPVQRARRARCGKALAPSFPQIAAIHLDDYKVRILDGRDGTAAITRVLDRRRATASARWTTVGASPNIIEASWQALADGIEYAVRPRATAAAPAAAAS